MTLQLISLNVANTIYPEPHSVKWQHTISTVYVLRNFSVL